MTNTHFRLNGETHVSYGTIQSVLEAGGLAHCFPMSIELLFERNIAYLSGFSFFFFYCFIIHMCIQSLGHFSPLLPPPPLPSTLPPVTPLHHLQ
jgi:hypothetical protein